MGKLQFEKTPLDKYVGKQLKTRDGRSCYIIGKVPIGYQYSVAEPVQKYVYIIEGDCRKKTVNIKEHMQECNGFGMLAFFFGAVSYFRKDKPRMYRDNDDIMIPRKNYDVYCEENEH